MLTFSDELVQVSETDRWPRGNVSLTGTVEAIPVLESLKLRPGERVLIRADLDLPIDSGGNATDVSRVAACLPTVQWCIERGARVLLAGHIGRDPSKSLAPVARAWQQELGQAVPLLEGWFDETSHSVTEAASSAVDSMRTGSVVMLENFRRYTFETAAWGKSEDELRSLAASLEAAARSIASLVDVEVIECIAAGNFDFSSSVLPLVVRRVATGRFLRAELLDHVAPALDCQILLMSGLKANKLDDLERIVGRAPLDLVFVGGALSMPLLHAEAQRANRPFELGRVGYDESLPSYVPSKRLEQAAGILEKCSRREIRLVLPIDFVLSDGRIATGLGRNDVQLDVGPKTIMHLDEELTRTIQSSTRRPTAFVNGAPGKYEDPSFSAGTKSLVEILTDMTSATDVYIGGGDGRAAFELFGELEKVKYAFTSGGTILKLMGGSSIPYLNAGVLATVDA